MLTQVASVHWELSSAEEMAHIKFPSSELPDGAYLSFVPNIQERTEITHGSENGSCCKNKWAGCENSIQRQLMSKI